MNVSSIKKIALATVGTGALIAATPGYAQTESSEDGDRTSEIVVTGERMSRSLLDTKTSVSVITKDQLERSGLRSVYDVIAGTPNLTPAPGDFLPGIRGENTSGAGGLGGGILFGTIPTATLIVDDIARSSNYSNSAFTSIFDVQQVEILRGPQTTLRGANALAGAYLIKTQNPKFTTEGEVFAEVTHDAFAELNSRFAAMGNVVLKENQVALRVVVERTDGELPFDVRDNSTYPAPAGADFNAARKFYSTRARAKLRIEPSDVPGLSTIVSAEYEVGLDQGSKSFVNNELFNGGLPLDRRIKLYGDGRTFDIKNYAFGLNTVYEFGDASIRSITSYQKSELGTDESSTDRGIGFDKVDQETFNQDLLLSFGNREDFIRGLVGGSFNRTKIVNMLTGLPFTDDGRADSESIFADVQVRVAPRLELQLGGRLNHSNIIRNNNVFGVSTAVNQNETLFLPKVGIEFEVSDTQRFGLSARKGFNPGNGGADFGTLESYEWQSETVWSYEATYRGQFANDNITLTGSAFLNDGKNKQFLIVSEANPSSFRVFNVPDTRSYGFELEMRANVSKNLDVNAGIGLLRTDIRKAPADTPSIQGNRFGLDPSFTGSLSVNWRPIDGLDLSGSTNYVSRYLGDFKQDPNSKSGDYMIFNISAGYNTGSTTVRIFLNNVTNKFAIFQNIPTSGAYVLPPRTLGGNIRFEF